MYIPLLYFVAVHIIGALCFGPPPPLDQTCLVCQDTVWASAKLRQWQREMAALWKRQDEKGGIIDVERDKKLLVIGATDPSPP